jgi:pimeloyl-ACP methyl ester carboxylesterase
MRYNVVMTVHRHGQPGRPLVVAIHGGPGAPGSFTSVAAKLGERFAVLEPWQRPSSDVPLTVAQHVADLRQLLDEHAAEGKPALVGHSWGAMLALIFAGRYPERVGPLVAVCPGTFDTAARARFHELRKILRYDHTPLPDQPHLGDDRYDARANRETWNDYLRLEQAGEVARFAAIRSPVLLLHGAADPHPGLMIRQTLVAQLPRLEYVEWARCGHEPWRETHARDDFFATLFAWLTAQLT